MWPEDDKEDGVGTFHHRPAKEYTASKLRELIEQDSRDKFHTQMMNQTLNNSALDMSKISAADWSATMAVDPEKQRVDDELKSHERRLRAIEDQQLILRRDRILEEQFNELREAWEAYNYTLEKLKTFQALQDSA